MHYCMNLAQWNCSSIITIVRLPPPLHVILKSRSVGIGGIAPRAHAPQDSDCVKTLGFNAG